MKTIFSFLVAVFVSLIGFTTSASISFTRSYDGSKISTETVTIDSINYTKIIYDGVSQATNPGDYDVPVDYVRFSVPANAVDFQVIQSVTDNQLGLTLYNIAKVQAVTSNGDWTLNPIIPDRPTVTSHVKIVNVGYMDGCNKVVTVAIYPVIPNNGKSSYVFAPEISFDLSWSVSSDLSKEDLTPIFRGNYSSENSDMVKNLVENPECIENNKYDRGISPLTVDLEEIYNHIVITSVYGWDEEKYIARRGLKGYPTKVIHLSEILNNQEYREFNRPEEKLRAFLKYAYSNYGTESVLFIGKYPDFPIAYLYSYHRLDNESLFPSDLYFSDLNTNWKYYDKGFIAISPNAIDFYSELNIGRIPAQNVQEVENYLDKLYNFEWNPGNGDASYLHNAIMTRQNIYDWYTNETMKPFLDLYEGRLIDLTESVNYPSGSDVVKVINSSKTGCWNFVGHGNPEGVTVSTVVPTKAQKGLSAIDNQVVWLYDEIGNGLDCLNNKDYPSWSYSMSCSLMPFDKKPGYDNISYNFGESYILGKDYGGVVFIGNTRDSYTVEGEASINKFFKLLQSSEKNEIGSRYAGNLLFKMKTTENYFTHCNIVQNLFGDPLVNLWIDEPEKLSYTLNKINGDEWYEYTINTNQDDLYMGVKSLEYAPNAYVSKFSQEILNSTYCDNNIFTIYGPNSIPVILPLFITNFEFQECKRQYIEADDVFIGTKVNRWEDGGRVKLLSDADVEIHATGNVTLAREIIFERRASLKIVADGDVDFSDITVPAGCTLIIEANTINYSPDENNFEEGSIVGLVERNPKQKKLRSRSVEAPQFFKEGRTYWYEYKHAFGAVDVEFGVRIGEKKIIDGKEWFTINLVNRLDRDLRTQEVKEYSENAVYIANIREENGEIFRSFAGTDFYSGTLPEIWRKHLYSNYNTETFELTDTPIFGFGPLGFSTKVDDLHGASEAIVTDVEDIENSGRTYKKYTLTFEPNYIGEKLNAVVIETIGAFGPYRDDWGYPNSTGDGEMIYHPFRAALSGVDYNPVLRYVTEGDDNTIIFEREGGFKLWEYNHNQDGVDAVGSDADAAPRWFNLQGLEIPAPEVPGIYIKKTGSKVEKIHI